MFDKGNILMKQDDLKKMGVSSYYVKEKTTWDNYKKQKWMNLQKEVSLRRWRGQPTEMPRNWMDTEDIWKWWELGMK